MSSWAKVRACTLWYVHHDRQSHSLTGPVIPLLYVRTELAGVGVEATITRHVLTR